jgi:hypothetical protein
MNDLLPVGTELTITLSPSWSGKPVGLVLRMEDKDGEVIGMAFDKTDAPTEATEAGDSKSTTEAKNDDEECVCD